MRDIDESWQAGVKKTGTWVEDLLSRIHNWFSTILYQNVMIDFPEQIKCNIEAGLLLQYEFIRSNCRSCRLLSVMRAQFVFNLLFCLICVHSICTLTVCNSLLR